jgi:transposase
LIERLEPTTQKKQVVMDKAYEGDHIRYQLRLMGYEPVVPPKANRKNPWKYDKEIYKCRNEIERLFRRLDSFRRVYTRYDKLDSHYLGFIELGLIFIAIN